MKIYLRNEIALPDQLEVVEQAFPLEVTEKKGSLYLLYHNEEQERVAIRCEEEELVMTRFSQPKSIMRFVNQQEALITLPTPMGLQHFVTVTEHYQIDRKKQEIQLAYDLKPLDSEQVFASYQMLITWG